MRNLFQDSLNRISNTMSAVLGGGQNRAASMDEDGFISIFGQPGDKGKRTNLDWLRAIQESPALQAVVKRIATDTAAKADWHLYRRQKVSNKGKLKKVRLEENDPHAANKFFKNVWSHAGGGTWISLIRIIQGWKDTTGNAFLLIERDEVTNAPIGLIPIPVTAVNVIQTRVRGSKREVHNWFEVTVPGTDKVERIPEDDMIWIRDPSWSDPHGLGDGIAQCLNDELNQDENAAKFNSAFFRNGATPHMVVGVQDKEMDDAELQRFRARWEAKHRGVSNAFRTLFINRPITAAPFSAKHKDMEFNQLRKNYRDNALMVFQMPPVIMGIIEDSNRASAQASMLTYAELVLETRMQDLANDLNRLLFQRFWPDVWLGFCTPAKVTQEFKLQKVEFAWQNGLITAAQACEELDLDPPDGDSGTWRMVPANMVLIDKAGKPVLEPQQSKPGLKEPNPKPGPSQQQDKFLPAGMVYNMLSERLDHAPSQPDPLPFANW